MIKILRQINTSGGNHRACLLLPSMGAGQGALILSAIVRIRREQNKVFALASTLCGFLTAYLMNRERLRVHDESGLISAQLTGWFWLGFLSTFTVAISGIAMLVRRQRAL